MEYFSKDIRPLMQLLPISSIFPFQTLPIPQTIKKHTLYLQTFNVDVILTFDVEYIFNKVLILLFNSILILFLFEK